MSSFDVKPTTGPTRPLHRSLSSPLLSILLHGSSETSLTWIIHSFLRPLQSLLSISIDQSNTVGLIQSIVAIFLHLQYLGLSYIFYNSAAEKSTQSLQSASHNCTGIDTISFIDCYRYWFFFWHQTSKSANFMLLMWRHSNTYISETVG